MVRSEFVTRLAAQNPHLSEQNREAIVHAILGRIEDALAAGDRVELRGFGAFSIKTVRGREGRNPRTGESVVVEEKKAVHFKAGKEIRQRLNPEMSDALPELRRVG
ncbi:integration host factor subunit beta [Methylobacterium sp. BE186]|uniref:integration host factor subunit beta n=1 Tax=Methylobacterium sp. BE186 TaxID=2817715 RepID=UPI002857D108|nr:integration host factor subunit beta [Methylobacterium sp. BE186]MDR7039735.1 integration host factor subunit beta [Methylobacterium sp. BE186]